MYLRDESESDFRWAAPGRYPLRINLAEPTLSKAGSDMIKLELSVEGGEFDGVTVFDYALTGRQGERVKGAGFGKKKLRGLGVNVDSETPIPDAAICQQLLGKLVYADLKVQPRMGKNPQTGEYDIPQTTIDERGVEIVAMNNSVENYYLHATGAAQTQVLTAGHVQQVSAQHLQTPPPGPGVVGQPQQPQQYTQPAHQQQFAAPPGFVQGQPVQGQLVQGQPIQGQAPNGGGFAQFPPQMPAPWAGGQPQQQADAGGARRGGKKS